MMERQMWSETLSERAGVLGDSLDAPSGEDYGRRHGHQPGFESSMYTRAVLSDVVRAAPLIAIGAAVAARVALPARR